MPFCGGLLFADFFEKERDFARSGNFLRRSMICAFALCRLSGAILSFDT